MPLCDGHEATRRIRAMEADHERAWAEEERKEAEAAAAASGGGACAFAPRPSSARRPPAWIIGLSAHAGVEDRDEGLAAGMNVFLTKPVKPDVLRATVLQLEQQACRYAAAASASSSGGSAAACTNSVQLAAEQHGAAGGGA